jgi:hypothetical protein
MEGALFGELSMQQLFFAPHETEMTLPRAATTGQIGNHAARAQNGHKRT